MQLITYTDRLGGSLANLSSLLDNELAGLFDGVHLLPFFDPIDGADAGFDPIDHTRVDPRVGEWSDIAYLARRYSVMADLIVNHVSAQSPQFEDVRRHGHRSLFWPMFLKRESVFTGDATTVESDIAKVYRPRPGRPFTTFALGDGTQREFWTTFSSDQIDIDVETPTGRAYLASVLQRFALAGIQEIRLDAAGYAIKRQGTDCFMLPETFAFIAALSETAATMGMRSLVEIHSHYQTQIDIAAQVDRVYDFALPPLVLHTLYRSDATTLKRWLRMAPRNCVTVLDTHDGIGIVDVGPDSERAGLLSPEDIDQLVETIHERTQGQSRRASGRAASNLDIYQVNATYYDALGRDDLDYLIARAIQFFSPGIPQVYYVGLLAGHNDVALVDKTGVGRDINRARFSSQDVRSRLSSSVVERLRELIDWRRALPVFDGEFSIEDTRPHELGLCWAADTAHAKLFVDLIARRATISATVNGEAMELTIDAQSAPGRACARSRSDASG